MPRSEKSWAIFASASATSTWLAPVNLARRSIESASLATKRSASSARWREPVCKSSGCMGGALAHRAQPEGGTEVRLFEGDARLTNQLENREERDDDVRAVEPAAKLEELDDATIAYDARDVFHLR